MPATKKAAAAPTPQPVQIQTPTTYTVLFAAAIQGLLARGYAIATEEDRRDTLTTASQIADAAVAIDVSYIPR